MNSKVAVLPACRLRPPTVRVPTLAPGIRLAPEARSTAPAILPVPLSVVPELNVTAPDPVALVPLMKSVPPLTIVPPE